MKWPVIPGVIPFGIFVFVGLQGLPTNVLAAEEQEGLTYLFQKGAMKNLFFICLWATLFSVGSTVTFAQVDRSDPVALTKTVTQQILGDVRQGAIRQGDIQSVTQLMTKDVLPYVDVVQMMMLTVGRDWASATPTQQKALRDQFQWMLIQSYSHAFAQINPNQQIDYQLVRRSDRDAVVCSNLWNNVHSIVTPICYRLIKTGGAWFFYDLKVQGAWLIEAYRQDFSQIETIGIDGLIQWLVKRNQQLAALSRRHE